MKIVILVHNLTGGGAERVASLWAQGFSEQGDKVCLLLSDDQSPITYLVPSEVKILYHSSKDKSKYIRLYERLSKLRNILRQERPDVIIGVMTPFLYYLAAIGFHIPFVNTEHNSFERPVSAPMTIKGKIKKFILNRLYNQVTVLTMADYMIANKNLHNIAVLPNPLAFPTAKIIPQKKQTVLAIGRLDAWHCKGFDVLIKAWSRIATNTSQWRLQIVGNGNKGKFYLRGLCQELGVSESVEFIDYQDDIQPFYQSAAIFVLCSRYEGFGMALIEAMSQGCACIASDYKGRQREIIRNEDEGILCEPENVTQLAEAIKRLINEKEKREYIARNAIERSKDYSLDKIMKKWDEILQKL